MKAYVLHEINKFTLEETKPPVAEANEVIVRVKAAGICGSDIPRIFTSGTYHYPLIPGHEFSGEVVPDADDREKLGGKRVGVFPLIPCRKCSQCMAGKYEMCRDYDYIGSRRNGAFAQYVSVPKDNLIFLPENVSFEAAAMLEPAAVAAHAVRAIKPKKDETVAVCGLGTIGLLVVMMLLEAGIKDIIVFGNHEYQRQTAVSLGVKPENVGLKNRPIDVFFECVGSEETVGWAINLTKPGGRVMLVGNPRGDMLLSKDTYWKILRNQLTLLGTWNSSFSLDGFKNLTNPDDWNYVLDRMATGKLNVEKLITHRFDMDNFHKGFEIMRDKSEPYTKEMMCLE